MEGPGTKHGVNNKIGEYFDQDGNNFNSQNRSNFVSHTVWLIPCSKGNIQTRYLQWFFRFWSVNVNVFDYSFLTVHLTTVHRSWPFVWTFHDRTFHVWPVKEPKKLRNDHETFMNGQKRLDFQERQRTLRDERRFETFMLHIMNGLKRFQNHIHASKTYLITVI